MRPETDVRRLPWRFHDTFMPERAYLRALLAFAAQLGSGTKEAISEKTGIPTGVSTGKVVPHLRYAEAMGLIAVTRPQAGVFSSHLTPLGLEVYRQDPGLDEPFTQWLAHLHLCRRDGGADAWHFIFADGHARLGMRCHQKDVEALVAREHDGAKLGPMVAMYREPNAFGRARIVVFDDDQWTRATAPLAPYWAAAWAFFLLSAWEQAVPDQLQITAVDFERATDVFAIAGWTPVQLQAGLDLAASTGLLRVARQLDVPVMTRLGRAEALIPKLFTALP